jgi:hypothetical protein
MRLFIATVTLTLSASLIFAQGDRGTITGTIADPAGAVVANAAIEAKNTDTGAVYPAQSTTTGNYTLSELPAGPYEISVTVPGFKKYVRQGLTIQVAAILRIDVRLEVGNASESITVSEAAPLLQTESGEVSHNVSAQRMDELPVLQTGAAAGSSSIRNPTAAVQLVPGAYLDPNVNLKVNGAPANTAAFRVDGQDASNGYVPGRPQQDQISVDAIQEVTIQTSNFAAEYGQVGGGFFNYTMKSGTNQFHGTAYDYFANEVLNAGTPFTNDGRGNLLRPAARRNDYGFTLGGPIWIPRVYNGHDKTFFFFNFEQFREFENINNQSITVPTPAYRSGDFSAALITSKVLGTDPMGRPIFNNQIYDPDTQRVFNGQVIRDAFPNNTIPQSRFDPVAVKVQNLIPLPNQAGLINNAIFPYVSDRLTTAPSFKIDHNLNANQKLSFFFSEIKTASQYSNTTGGADGLPPLISAAIGTFITSHLLRLNYEHVLTPALLLHFGGGYQDLYFSDNVVNLNYDSEAELGLKGATVKRMFPAFQNASNAYGGVKNLGPSGNRNIWYQKPTFNASLTWVKDNHTYKFGSEARFEGVPTLLYTASNGVFSFNAAETSLPYLNNISLNGGTVGFPYASFLLGLVNSGQIANPPTARVGQYAWGFFAQDSWKVSHRFTLDYGLRYDYQSYPREQYGRYPNFSPTAPNPSAGGLPGAVIFEGDGPGHCNCSFGKIYPYAFGPRLGAAWQLDSKTVIRAGFGVIYSGTPTNNQTTTSISIPSPFSAPSFGTPAMVLDNGIPITPSPWPNLDGGQYPIPGTLTPPKMFVDQNAGRPARQLQWSIGVQRQLFANLAVEATYVGNRGAWWTAPGLIDVNALTPQILAAHGLSLNTTADQQLLISPLNSSLAVSRGFNTPPYAGFPTTATVAQSLRPFPQFTSITSLWSPLGDTWYNSLQLKATKRTSHGLTLSSVFSWQKQLTLGSDIAPTAATTGGEVVNNVFNRQVNKNLSQFDQPFLFNTAVNYLVPTLRFGSGAPARAASWFVRDWTVSAYLAYQSGLPILSPFANNNLQSLLLRNLNGVPAGVTNSTFANRVPGVPLYTVDVNCHCYDPNSTFVLNPAAWSQPGPGQFGTAAAYYSDYRYMRRPIENMALGRTFRFHERVSLNIRAEFTNVFNRARINDPTGAAVNNAQAPQQRNAAGQTTAGFGYISTAVGSTPATGVMMPRQGQIVAKFTF